MKKKYGLTAAFIAGLLVACGSQVEALSSADAQRINTLETQVAQLQTSLQAVQASVTTLSNAARPAVFVQAPQSAAVKAMTTHFAKAATASTTGTTCTGLGTLTGRPDTSNPITSNLLAGVSCAGYLYVISQAATASEYAQVQPYAGAVFFTSTDCTGEMYVARDIGAGQPISSGAYASGAVFTLGDINAPTYMYLPAAAQGVPITVNSLRYNNQICQTLQPVAASAAVQLLPNDPAITGIPSAPIAGPITIGTGV